MNKYKYIEYNFIGAMSNGEYMESRIIEARDFDDLQDKLRNILKLEDCTLSYSKDSRDDWYNCCWKIPTQWGVMTARYGRIEEVK